MSKSVNRVILVGNAGSDPDVKETANGKTVAHLSLATNHQWRNAEGVTQSRTSWHRLTFWNGAAGVIAKHVRKGSRLYVEGRIEYGSYERDGTMIPTCDIQVEEFVFLDSKKDGEV
jgi:single-strand DNA-binding protein